MAVTKFMFCKNCNKRTKFVEKKDLNFYCMSCGLVHKEDEEVVTPVVNAKTKALEKEREAIEGLKEDVKELLDIEEEEIEEALELERPDLELSTDEEEVEVEEEEAPIEEEIEEEVEEEIPLEFQCGPSESLKGKVSSFYEIYTTYEDADPYIDDELLVVCDGCGGAGSTKHILNYEDFGTYEKIKNIVLPEDKNDCLKPHLETLYKPILDEFKENGGRRIVHTSAFLASRIVLPRFIYGFKKYKDSDLSFEDKIVKIKDFIYDGMRREAKELNLVADPHNSKAVLLATTFVSVVFNGDPENDEEVDCDAIWAGDSRAYVLLPDGLRKIIDDDEDTGGFLDNLFGFKGSFETRIHHRHYKFKKPCMIFTCSDGIFDSLKDSLDLDLILTQMMREEGCNSLDDFTSMLKNIVYRNIKGDDCTFAVRAFGFKDFDDIRETYKERFQFDEALYGEKTKYSLYLDLYRNPNLLKDALRNLAERFQTEVALSKMSVLIADEMKKGNFEDVFTKEFKKVYDHYEDDKESLEKLIKKEKIRAIDNIASFLNEDDNYLSYSLKDLFNKEYLDEEKQNEFDSIMENYNKYTSYLKEKETRDTLDKNIHDELSVVWDFMVKKVKRYLVGLSIPEEYVSEEAKEKFLIDNINENVTDNLAKCLVDLDPSNTSKVKEYEEKIKKLKSSQILVEEMEEKGFDKVNDELQKQIKDFFDVDKEKCLVLFDALNANNEAVNEHLRAFLAIDKSVLEENALAARIYNKLKEYGPEKLVDIRVDSKMETTVIDPQLNFEFLNKCLKYSSIDMNRLPEEVKEFLYKMDEYEEKVVSLLVD